MTEITPSQSLRRAVLTVAILNLGYFFVEFASAISISSVSLFADSIDFLEDTSVNLLILLALGWSSRRDRGSEWRSPSFCWCPASPRSGRRGRKFRRRWRRNPVTLSVVGAGALAVNVTCAFILARFRAGSRQPH